MIPVELVRPLSRLRVRCLALAALRGAGLGLAIFLIGCVLAGWTDLIFRLPFALRFSLTAACLIGAVGTLLFVLAAMSRRSVSARLADTLDRVGSTGGQIRAGVELGQAPVPPDPLTADLRTRAIRMSGSLAEQQNLALAEPLSPSLRPFAYVAAVLVLLAGAWLAWPGVLTAQAARVLDPRADRAPHCPYIFEIRPSASKVIYGDPFDVTVHVSGAEAREHFEWVVEQPGREAWVLPLIAHSDGTLQGNIGSVVSDFSFIVRGPKGASAPTAIGVLTVPEIKESAVRLVFPAYTRLAPVEGPLQSGGPAGVRGTQVTLIVASNRPLSGGTIELRAEGAAPVSSPMKPAADSHIVQGSFEITADLQFSAVIRDVDGTAARAPLQGRCLLIPDQPPRVALREPLPKSFATPDIALPVVIETEDDFGISEVLLYRSLNGSREIPFKVALPPERPISAARGPQVARYSFSLPLKEWGLEPGDELTLSALARDNDPAGAKTAQSPVHRILMIDHDRYLDMLRQQETIDDLYERYKPWLRRLVELREKWEQAHKKANDPKELAVLREALRESVEQLEEQLKEPAVFSADLQLAKELRELQESLRKALADLDAGDYDGVQAGLQAEEEEADKNLDLPLEMLTKLYRLIEDESLFTALAQAQEDLAHRASRFEKMETVTVMQDQRDLRALAEEEQQLSSALDQVVQDIRDHAGHLPKNDESFAELIKTANDFATKVHDMEITKVLDAAAAAMEKQLGTKGHDEAQKAAVMMMSLVEKLQGGGMGGKALAKLRKFGPYMLSTVNELLGGKGLPGPGQTGGGRGFSMGHAGKTGLYGNKPQKRRGSGGGKDSKKGGPGNSGIKLEEAAGFGHIKAAGDGPSAGVPLGAIPSRYRSAVRDFNRRIADEGVSK